MSDFCTEQHLVFAGAQGLDDLPDGIKAHHLTVRSFNTHWCCVTSIANSSVKTEILDSLYTEAKLNRKEVFVAVVMPTRIYSHKNRDFTYLQRSRNFSNSSPGIKHEPVVPLPVCEDIK